MATRAAPGVRLAELQGGDKHNAIPREGRAALLVPDESRDAVEAALISEVLGLREAYGALETDMHVTIHPASVRPTFVTRSRRNVSTRCATQHVLRRCPGVIVVMLS